MEQAKIKYTNDGKKVIVIGDLNSNEKIVQEIFVKDGKEIPSGDNFVAKVLHDTPILSWKEKNLKDIDEKYEKIYKLKSAELESIEKECRLKIETAKAKLSFIKKCESKLTKEKLEQLINFISGDVSYIVKDDYGTMEIDEYDKSIATKDYGRFDSLRLVSVFGKTDGDICYKMNEYYDGSGSWKYIYPCKSQKEAMVLMKKIFNEKLQKGLNSHLLKTANKYNLKIPQHILSEYNNKQQEALIIRLNEQKEQIKKIRQQIADLKV